MKKESRKCPKCGFYMTDNYCIKCGYTEGVTITDTKKYEEEKSDLELLLKQQYKDYIYEKNGLLIFILGPLFLSYSGYFWIGCILNIISLRVSYLIYYHIGPISAISYLLFTRIIYLLFANRIILYLYQKKIEEIKVKNNNYQEILSNTRQTSLSLAIIALCIAISILIILYL